MPEFKVGDRVICVEDNPYGNDDIFAGNTGTVCREDDYGDVGVCWDDKVEGGHNCDGSCEYGFGWYVSQSSIQRQTNHSSSTKSSSTNSSLVRGDFVNES